MCCQHCSGGQFGGCFLYCTILLLPLHFQHLVQDKEDAFQSVLESKRSELQETAPISIARVLAARQGWAAASVQLT